MAKIERILVVASEAMCLGVPMRTDPHAYAELTKDGLETTDAVNVLRGGVVAEAEFEHGAWRYRVSTARICVVVEFASANRLVVITAWRIRR